MIPGARDLRPSGHRYGTLRSEIDRIAADDQVCVLELETEGALAVKRTMPGAVTIFITAPLDELERRLRERATESAGEIGERVELARRQVEQADEFDYVVVNDDRDRAAEELTRIVSRELNTAGSMTRRDSPRIDELLEHVDSRYALVIVAAKRARQIKLPPPARGGTFDERLPSWVALEDYLTMGSKRSAGQDQVQYRS